MYNNLKNNRVPVTLNLGTIYMNNAFTSFVLECQKWKYFKISVTFFIYEHILRNVIPYNFRKPLLYFASSVL